jgi:hypothetical protein
MQILLEIQANLKSIKKLVKSPTDVTRAQGEIPLLKTKTRYSDVCRRIFKHIDWERVKY